MSNENTLHTIGELCTMCGVTRRMVLNYEAHELINPVSIDKNTGYRYYNATSAARICHIKSLQTLGFSLNNIKKFLSGDYNILREHLAYLEAMKSELEGQIYRTKALLTSPGDYSVHIEKLPAAHYVTKTEVCSTYLERFTLLQSFTDYVFSKGWQVSNKGRGLISIMQTSPDGNFSGKMTAAWSLTEPNAETVFFPETNALVLNVKGEYNLLSEACKALYTYAHDNNHTPSGDIRIAFLTSPQSHTNPENYMTQIFLPIN